jgi:hypothetical protein
METLRQIEDVRKAAELRGKVKMLTAIAIDFAMNREIQEWVKAELAKLQNETVEKQ